jgi:hypothetical protein
MSRPLRALSAFVFLSVCLSGAFAATSPDRLWQVIDQLPPERTDLRPGIRPEQFTASTLDSAAIRRLLATAPMEFSGRKSPRMTVITLPTPDGGFARFEIEEAPVMEPELAARFPEIKTYRGRGIDDPSASLVLDINPRTVHAQVLSPSGAYYVDPYYQFESSLYMSYRKADVPHDPQRWKCHVEGSIPDKEMLRNLQNIDNADSGKNLRRYRLALATSMQYSMYHSSDETNPNVPEVMAALVTLLNRVNGIYERELAIRMVLVAQNHVLISTLDNPQPYTDTPGDIDINGPNINLRIGVDAYDIGHVVTVGSGGVAYLGSVCRVTALQTLKAGGTTGLNPPTGDPFWVDYVAHEMGHQFGGNHTFNGDGTNCGTNSNRNTAYEPGSGSTIQAYAGICGSANNLQANSDPYFHFISLIEMFAYSATAAGNSCALLIPTGNNPPTVSARPAGVGAPPAVAWTIPSRTPFTLTAVGEDPDGDAITYAWEEADLGPTKAATAPDDGASPIFRSFMPTSSPSRTFPRLANILTNQTQTIGEKLPTTTRKLDFRVTVRDQRPIGGFGMDIVRVNVIDNGQGFAVTSPNTAVSYPGGAPQLVTWNTTGTENAPINATHVDILMSTNGGSTFHIKLAENTPNDGTESVTIPFVSTTAARIKIQAVNNIFFDISDANFTVFNVDTDGDGMPDAWELANGLNPNDPSDAALDRDGDGQSNLAEFTAGTNPNDPHSVLKVVAVNRSPGAVSITFTSEQNRRYRLESSPDLFAAWTTVADNISGTGSTVTVPDNTAGTAGANPPDKRFYRVRVFQ